MNELLVQFLKILLKLFIIVIKQKILIIYMMRISK
jgi:hypothetical protein